MAASKLSSPTANLFRTSRLFSLPPPLPRPKREILANSETATLPYPTYAAISTPPSALSRGDWGLKRPLPTKKLTNVSDPVIRALNLDEIGGTTDFESAADHVQTLRKFQDLDIPVLSSSRSSGGALFSHTGKSAFDDEGRKPQQMPALSGFQGRRLDPKDPGSITPSSLGGWKHAGPRVVDLDDIEFNRFLEDVRPKREAFHQFLREKAIQKRTALVNRLAAEQRGRKEPTQPRNSSDEEIFREYLVGLRMNPDALDALISEFLDLAPSPLVTNRFLAGVREPPKIPPVHRSAGLSYLRTPTHMPNHPFYGPQQHPDPVEARVLATQGARHNRSSRKKQAQIGVAGFVTVDNQLAGQGIREVNSPDVVDFLVDQPGGGKMLVKPLNASVDVDGLIVLDVERPSHQAIDVMQLAAYKRDVARGSIPKTYEYLPDLSAPVGIRRGIVESRERVRLARSMMVTTPAQLEARNAAAAAEFSGRFAKQLEKSQEEAKDRKRDPAVFRTTVRPTPAQVAEARQRLEREDPQYEVAESGLRKLKGAREHRRDVDDEERYEDWKHMTELLMPVVKEEK